jgi:hypothetical protein
MLPRRGGVDPELHAAIYTEGREVIPHAVRSLVRPATRGMRVVAKASSHIIAGRSVVRRRASLHSLAPGGRGGDDG